MKKKNWSRGIDRRVLLILIGILLVGASWLVIHQHRKIQSDAYYSVEFFGAWNDILCAKESSSGNYWEERSNKKIQETKAHMHEEGYTWAEIDRMVSDSFWNAYRANATVEEYRASRSS